MAPCYSYPRVSGEAAAGEPGEGDLRGRGRSAGLCWGEQAGLEERLEAADSVSLTSRMTERRGRSQWPGDSSILAPPPPRLLSIT